MPENQLIRKRGGSRTGAPGAGHRFWACAAVVALFSGALAVGPLVADSGNASSPATLDETRLALSKWIETQQIITKERNEWQQGKEILNGRIELVEKEIANIQESIRKSETVVADAKTKRDGLQKQNDELKAVGTQLNEAVTAMEVEVRKLFKGLPTPVQEKLQPLFNRIPQDPATTHVSVAERYQNVLGILNEVNKSNSEITVNYEVHEGAEAKVVYIGLGQAYYVSGTGAAGISHPSPDGWQWESSKSISGDVSKTLEIIQGKQTAVFVPLPMKIK